MKCEISKNDSSLTPCDRQKVTKQQLLNDIRKLLRVHIDIWKSAGEISRVSSKFDLKKTVALVRWELSIAFYHENRSANLLIWQPFSCSVSRKRMIEIELKVAIWNSSKLTNYAWELAFNLVKVWNRLVILVKCRSSLLSSTFIDDNIEW